MDTLSLDHLTELAQAHGDVRVSLYMPTRRFGPGSQEEDTTRLKNLLRTAEERLADRGLRPAAIDALLAPARTLIDDRPFWLRSSHGLALLLGPDGIRAFQVPSDFEELVWVGPRFHLRPLLTVVHVGRPFWLLALSQKRVRVMRGTGTSLEEVPAEGVPTSLADALKWDDYEKSSLQFHTGTSGSGGRRPAVFHGTGETDAKVEITRYFRGIDHGLRDLLKDSDAPLVLAGVDYLLPLYRDVNSYPHLVDEAIIGNPDGLTDTDLHERVWSIVSGVTAAELRKATDHVHEHWASPRVTPDPEAIVAAAHHGRVDTLMIAEGAHWWGAFDAESGLLATHAEAANGDEDTLDRAAIETLMHGGSVLALPQAEMPHEKDAVALLRY